MNLTSSPIAGGLTSSATVSSSGASATTGTRGKLGGDSTRTTGTGISAAHRLRTRSSARLTRASRTRHSRTSTNSSIHASSRPSSSRPSSVPDRLGAGEPACEKEPAPPPTALCDVLGLDEISIEVGCGRGVDGCCAGPPLEADGVEDERMSRRRAFDLRLCETGPVGGAATGRASEPATAGALEPASGVEPLACCCCCKSSAAASRSRASRAAVC